MAIKTQLTEDMKQAMRDKNRTRLDAVRYLISEIKNTEIDQGELSDEQVFQLIGKQVKQIKETIADYQKAGRDEIVAQEEEKVAVLEAYLPKQLSDEELTTIVTEVVAQMDDPQMGQVIGAVKSRVGAQADGGRIAAVVRQQLA